PAFRQSRGRTNSAQAQARACSPHPWPWLVGLVGQCPRTGWSLVAELHKILSDIDGAGLDPSNDRYKTRVKATVRGNLVINPPARPNGKSRPLRPEPLPIHPSDSAFAETSAA